MDGLDGSSEGLMVELLPAEGEIVIRLAGDMDLNTVDAVHETIERALSGASPKLVFDMAGVTFMDSSGIAVLLQAVNSAASVCIRTPSPEVRMVIEATGLSDVFTIER